MLEQNLHAKDIPLEAPSPFETYDDELTEEISRPSTSNFSWPPPPEYDHDAPTASPLYIPPPGTQHVRVKPFNPMQNDEVDNVSGSWLAQQSQSAPELTNLSQKEYNEAESCSTSYTSTCTTTTTTSEEYNKMYQAQTGCSNQYAYDQSTSDIDYINDVEMASLHQQYGSFSSASTDLMSFAGRRSVQECTNSLLNTVDTCQLVNYLKELTPAAETPPPKVIKRVEFAEPVHETISDDMPGFSKQKLEQPIHEIQKFEKCPETKQLPPSNISNPVPKEWTSLMVKALTTASDQPFHMSEAHEENIKCEDQVSTQMYTSKTICENSSRGIHSEYEINSDVDQTSETCFNSKLNALLSKRKESDDKSCEESDQKCNQNIRGNPKSITNYQISEPPFIHDEPNKGSFMTSVLTTASPYSVEWTKSIDELIPLPEETVPYFPPPISMTPYEKEDQFGKKSPFLDALITAPFRSYTPFEHDVITQLEDLPTPNQELTLIDALTVAPTESFNELTQELPEVTKHEKVIIAENERLEKQAKEVKQIISHTIETQMDRQISAFANFKGFRSVNPFKPKPDILPLSSSEINQSFTNTTESSSSEINVTKTLSSACTTQYNSTVEQKTVSFPPPPGIKCKSYIQSGLHKPETIPKYQRQWFNLPSQSPVRTPEPQELKENVPIAFLDAPLDATHIQRTTDVSVAVAEAEYTESVQQSSELNQENSTVTNVPVILENSNGAVTMPFQSLETEYKNQQRGVSPFRPHTPSLINKSAPTIPYYQQNLVAEEFAPSPSHLFDPRVQSPLPDRAKSPAPGPPPNPLKIHAPRIKSAGFSDQSHMQLSNLSLSSGQSLSKNDMQLDSCQSNLTNIQSGKLLSQYKSLNESGLQSFINKPEVVQQKQFGDLNIQTRANESQLNEQKRSDFQSASTAQFGNTQVQRKTRVVEEFEHTQKAKSIEIHKSSGGVVRSITADQGSLENTRSMSVDKKKIQQQQHMQSQNISKNVSFGQQQNIKNVNSHKIANFADHEQKQDFNSSGMSVHGQQSNVKEGFVAQQARRLSEQSQYTADLATYQSSFPQFSSVTPPASFPIKNFQPIQEEPKEPTYNVSKSINKSVPPPGYQQIQPKSNVTKNAQQITNKLAQNQSLLSSSTLTSSTTATAPTSIVTPAVQQISSKLQSAIPVPAFKPPLSAANDFKPTQITPNFTPTPSFGPGFKPPNTIPSAVVSDPSPASAGPNKGLTFGATSAPRRGRGILNKCAGPGGRIPQCGCCNAQIRGPFITALGRIWCPDHFVCVTANCRRPLQDIGFVEEKGNLYCEYCFEKYLAPPCDKCGAKIKGDCLNAIGKHFHPECFTCAYCGKLFGNSPFFLEDGQAYCENDWNELFTTKCFACGFPVEAGDRWVEALSHNYHSQCFNCTMCKKNLEGQSFFAKGGRPFCKNHAR